MLRNLIKEQALRRIMSMRFLIDCTDMLEAGWTIKECAESYFADWATNELQRVPHELRHGIVDEAA